MSVTRTELACAGFTAGEAPFTLCSHLQLPSAERETLRSFGASAAADCLQRGQTLRHDGNSVHVVAAEFRWRLIPQPSSEPRELGVADDEVRPTVRTPSPVAVRATHTIVRQDRLLIGGLLNYRRAKNRRMCGAIREAMESVQRQHKTELRSHRHTVAMRRHERQVAKARDLQAQKDAVKRRQVEEVLCKRDAQADATERRLQEAQARAEAGMHERMEAIQRNFEARRQKEATKAARREEAVELSLALQDQQRMKFQESAGIKAKRVRQQQRKNEELVQKHAEFVKRLALEKRANAATTKAAMLAKAECYRLQREEHDARRHELRVKQAAELQHRRKLLERDLWIDADKAKQGLAKFMQSGKADAALMEAVRDAGDTELVHSRESTETRS